MSELDLLQDEDLAPEREAVREPAKAWRNLWLALCAGRSSTQNRPLRDGEVYFAGPSFDTQKAAAEWANGVIKKRVYRNVWLGAYPEGERP